MESPVKKLNVLPAVLAIAVALASGCSTYQDKRYIDGLEEDVGGATKDQVARNMTSMTLDARRAAQDVNRPYITGKAIPLAREVTLPAPLRGTVNTTLLFKDDADLITLAGRITDATGIPVKVMPDALLPMEDFGPRLTSTPGQGASMGLSAPMTTNTNPVALSSPLPVAGAFPIAPVPAITGAPAPAVKSSVAAQAGNQLLAPTLDAAAMRLNVYWKWDDALGAIVFYRTETRMFEIRGAEMAASSAMSIDLAGGVDNSGTSGLNSKSKASIDVPELKDGPLAGLIERVTQFMSRSGKVAAGAGGLLVVTDIKSSLDQIEKFITQENKMRSRRIDLVFEEITVERTTSAQAGVNWNLMFTSGGAGNGVNINGLNSLLEQEGAAMSLGASVGSGQWAGSSVSAQALSKVGKIVDRKMNTFGAVNGQPATSGRPERQKYIDKLEQTASNSDASQPTVTVTQAEEVSGRIITVVPYAYSDGDINLAVKYDNTPTPIFEKQPVGQDGSYVQSPKSVSDVLVRSAIVRSGQPYVVSATTANNDTYNERRTDRSVPMLFGGSDIADKTDRVTVFVLTALVREK
jgi:type IVB pilus formation R64 PilN family outer membrane protein